MSEEHLRMLEALGTLAREEQPELRTLEALCDGERRRALLQRSPPVDEALAQATLPLSAESRARIAQHVREALREDRTPRGLPANQNTAEPQVKRKRPSARAAPRRVEPKPAPRPVRTFLSVALPLLAAAISVFSLLGAEEEPLSLPEYSLAARSEPEVRRDGLVALSEGATLELELRPAREYTGELELRVQLQQGAETVDLPTHVEQTAHGVLRARVERSALPKHGTARLSITLAHPGALQLAAARDPATLHGEGWQAWLVEVALP